MKVSDCDKCCVNSLDHFFGKVDRGRYRLYRMLLSQAGRVVEYNYFFLQDANNNYVKTILINQNKYGIRAFRFCFL